MRQHEQKKTEKAARLRAIKNQWPLAVLIISLLFINGCKEDDEGLPDKIGVTQTFEEVISTAGVPEKVEKTEEVIDSTQTEEIREDGSIWVCSTKTYSVEDGNPDFPLFNPNASVIYPGSLLQGSTLVNASPSVIPLPRAGGTISIDIIDGSGQPAFTVDEVTKSSIAIAANEIIGASTGVVPANFNATFEEISSVEHLAFSLGLNVESQYVEVAAKFDFTEEEGYSHFLVKLNQSFYTLSFDLPTTYDDLFAPEVTPDDLKQYAGPGNPVTFISDVTYGRIYYMLIEYSSSSMSIKSSLEAAFSGSVASAEISAAADYLKETSGLKIKIVAFGGESKSTFATIGETNISKLAELFGESTDIRSGVPISYVVRDAKDKETVSVKLATEYNVKECKPVATALGKPILWLDADRLDLTSDENLDPCTDCLAYNGMFRYFGPNDSYAVENRDGYDGTVVKKWIDISGNENHASAVADDANSRPMFVPDAFNNGRAAIEFFRAPEFNTFNKLTYSGGIFADTDYTIFVVVSVPDRVKVEWRDDDGDWTITRDKPNSYGYFMRGTSYGPGEQLIVGFQSKFDFRFSHLGSQVVIDGEHFPPKEQFQVLAFRFSQEEGMAIYANGILVARDVSKRQPLSSNAGAMICAGFVSSNTGYSRIRIGEIKAYQQAATEAQIRQETQYLNQKYGL